MILKMANHNDPPRFIFCMDIRTGKKQTWFKIFIVFSEDSIDEGSVSGYFCSSKQDQFAHFTLKNIEFIAQRIRSEY